MRNQGGFGGFREGLEGTVIFTPCAHDVERKPEKGSKPSLTLPDVMTSLARARGFADSLTERMTP